MRQALGVKPMYFDRRTWGARLIDAVVPVAGWAIAIIAILAWASHNAKVVDNATEDYDPRELPSWVDNVR